jgi:hypothetical protein
VGKFHTKLAAEDMALKLLTAFRDGAFSQYKTTSPQLRKPLPDAAEPAAWNRLYTANQMRAYATAAVAAERERCARIAEGPAGLDDEEAYYGRAIAAAIRGEQK